MYLLETSTGFRTETATVEQMAAALASQLGVGGRDLLWTIRTPHGSVISPQVGTDEVAGRQPWPFGERSTERPRQLNHPLNDQSTDRRHDEPDDLAARIDSAYALLLRDHLTRHARSAVDHAPTGLLHTRHVLRWPSVSA